MNASRRVAIFGLLFAVSAGVPSANAESILLGEVVGAYDSFSGFVSPPGPGGSYAFYLGYDFQSSPFSSPLPPLQVHVATNSPLDTIISTYDFNALNSAGFLGLTDRLTDEVDDVIFSITEFYEASGVRVEGAGVGRGDRSLFDTPEDWQIDFIRLRVDSFVFGPCCDGGFGSSTRIAWEIWGLTTPGPEPVTEPSTLLLLGTGATSLIAFGRRSRKPKKQ